MLAQLIYRSKALPTVSHKDIEDILTTSRISNPKYSITGCLLFHNYQFLQMLEGPSEAVEKLFSNIQQDSRHSEIDFLAMEPCNQRYFTSWFMALQLIQFQDIENLKSAISIEDFTVIINQSAPSSTLEKLFYYVSKDILRNP